MNTRQPPNCWLKFPFAIGLPAEMDSILQRDGVLDQFCNTVDADRGVLRKQPRSAFLRHVPLRLSMQDRPFQVIRRTRNLDGTTAPPRPNIFLVERTRALTG